MQKHEIVFFEEPNKSAADDLLDGLGGAIDDLLDGLGGAIDNILSGN